MKIIPTIAEFRVPPTESQSTEIAQAQDPRLERLCEELGITSTDKYRKLCLKLLDILDAEGVQVLNKPRKQASAPVVWTIRRHAALVRYVNKRISKGDANKVAIGRARNIFARIASKPHLTDQAVRYEYFRAKRFIEKVPHVAAAMLYINSKPETPAAAALAQFLKGGATVDTAYGPQLIAVSHLRQPKRKSETDSENIE